MEKRHIIEGILTHCYQRSNGGCILFYSDWDHLVFFTLHSIFADKYGIRVLSLCQMPDHIHESIITEDLQSLAAFKRSLNASFTKARNKWLGQSGRLFEHPYGSAVKNGAKKGRTNLIYVGNNPVERQLCIKADDYRWNYIAYAGREYPFSERIVIRRSQWRLRQALRIVDANYRERRPMSYPVLARLFRGLDQDQTQQLTDYIIQKYNHIQYRSALAFFDGSFEKYLNALHSTTGSEYDLNEVFVGRSDRCYADFNTILLRYFGQTDIHFVLRTQNKSRLYMILQSRTRSQAWQIRKYLRIEPKGREM